MSFLYFIPSERQTISREHLPPELAARLHDVPGWMNNAIRSGPGNQQGVVIDPTSTDASYYPNKQQWHKGDSEKPFWIGWEPEKLPGPKQLLRRKPLDGEHVELGDGNRWLIPILHGPGITVPRAYGFGPNGDVLLKTLPGYEEVLAASQPYFDSMVEGKSMGSYSQWLDFCCKLVGVNYRVGKEEALALQLVVIQEKAIWSILRVCLGVSAVDDAQKKRDPDTSEDSQDDEGTQPDTP